MESKPHLNKRFYSEIKKKITNVLIYIAVKFKYLIQRQVVCSPKNSLNFATFVQLGKVSAFYHAICHTSRRWLLLKKRKYYEKNYHFSKCINYISILL